MINMKPAGFILIPAVLLLAAGFFPACEPTAKKEDPPVILPLDTIKNYPDYCGEPKYCGELAYIDCGSATDGPSYYLERATGKRISTCGGACWIPSGEQVEVCRTLCPPKEWTCGF